MKTVFLFPALFALSLLPAARLTAADELLYFAASLENTTLADGTALKVVAKAPAAPGGNHPWHDRS